MTLKDIEINILFNPSSTDTQGRTWHMTPPNVHLGNHPIPGTRSDIERREKEAETFRIQIGIPKEQRFYMYPPTKSKGIMRGEHIEE